jgi:hypothetical protein
VLVAQRTEMDHAGVNCDILDQMASSLLDSGLMLFLDTRSLERSLLPLPAGAQVLVVDSGIARALATSKFNERRAECEEAARLLRVATLRDAGFGGPASRCAAQALRERPRSRARKICCGRSPGEGARHGIASVVGRDGAVACGYTEGADGAASPGTVTLRRGFAWAP